MLGFDAVGRLALGQVPSGTIQQALTAKCTLMLKLLPQQTAASAMQARTSVMARLRVQQTAASALSAKTEMMMRLRAPGGLLLTARCAGMMKVKATPGYLLFARVMMASSAMSSPHIEGVTTVTRLPLLLNAGSQYGASYWKGRD